MIDKIFIQHCKKLIDRKIYIDKIVNENDFFKEKSEIIIFDEEKDKEFLINNNYKYQPNLFARVLKNSEIFVTEQMLYIYRKIVSENIEVCLILEDDFIINNNFKQYAEDMFSKLPENFDAIFYSSCCNLEAPWNYNGYYFPSDSSRCTCAYLVTKSFCKKILENQEYFYPIDWHLNYLKNKLNLKFYWSKPIIFEQGSESVYKSNLR